MSVYVQPASQTPISRKSAMGMPGMTASHTSVLSAVSGRAPSCLANRYETAKAAATQPRNHIPETVARASVPVYGNTVALQEAR